MHSKDQNDSPLGSIHDDFLTENGGRRRQALDKWQFDAAFGGARRDEEKSRNTRSLGVLFVQSAGLLQADGNKSGARKCNISAESVLPLEASLPVTSCRYDMEVQRNGCVRDQTAARLGMDLHIHINEEGLARGISPVVSGSVLHTQVMKTEALRQELDKWQFDAAFGGARRDEEKRRAKERIFSHRLTTHAWDPRNQRPELWKAAARRIDARVSFVELDRNGFWEYIRVESIPVVTLYFAHERPVVDRNGMLIMVDDDRLPLLPGERPRLERVRFRTLGCYPLNGAIRSSAATLDDVIAEMRTSNLSERQGRLIDYDESGSMEKKKREGYF